MIDYDNIAVQIKFCFQLFFLDLICCFPAQVMKCHNSGVPIISFFILMGSFNVLGEPIS